MFLDLLEKNFKNLPDKPAIEFLDEPRISLTYAELDLEVQKRVNWLLAEGLRPGDRMAMQLPKCLEFILLHLAALRIGVVTLPLNPAYPLDEVLYFLEDSGSKIFFVDETSGYSLHLLQNGDRVLGLEKVVLLNEITPLVRSNDPKSISGVDNLTKPGLDDAAVIIYTSGTTGRPKGAVITYRNLSANLASLHEAWGWVADDVLLHVLPIFHVHGLFVALMGALYAGATSLLVRKFDAENTLYLLKARKCTVFMGVPTIHRRLVFAREADKYDLSKMRLITSGSDRLPDEIFKAFERMFGYTLLERYGMTETGMNMSNPLHGERRIGSVGLPLPGVEARIVNPDTEEPVPDGTIGMVQIRGAHVFSGYWKQPEKTTESFTKDGWLRTGDLGLREADGYYTLKGRSKDLIITGGLNVYPPEVERVLATHPAVATCAVIGCPDAEWGERIVAVVVVHPNQHASEEELHAYCREHIASYKSPREFYFAESLPQNAMGKVQKNQLRDRFCD